MTVPFMNATETAATIEQVDDGIHLQHYLQLIAVALVVLVGLVCTGLSFFCKSTQKERSKAHLSRTPTMIRERADAWNEDLQNMERQIEHELDTERYMTITFWSLYVNRPWRTEPGPKLPEHNMMPNPDWLGGVSFPGGEEETQSVLRMTLALWRFMWGKAPRDSRLCALLSVIEGLGPAVSAQIIACIVDNLDNGYSDLGSIMFLVALVLANVAVNATQDYAHYRYEREVPGASMRMEFRKRLQWAFLDMDGPTGAAWPPGRCIAVLKVDVRKMIVGVWMSLFAFIREQTNNAALLAVIVYQSRHAPSVALTVLGVLGVILSMAFANINIRTPNVVDLSLRKAEWAFDWLTVAGVQLERRRHGRLGESEVPKAVKMHADAALVYRKRGFHYYFFHLMSFLSNSQMALFAEAIIILIFGINAAKGWLPVSSAVGIITAMKAVKTNQTTSVKTWLDVVEGYASLMNVRRVFDAQLSLAAAGKNAGALAPLQATEEGEDEDEEEDEAEEEEDDRGAAAKQAV